MNDLEGMEFSKFRIIGGAGNEGVMDGVMGGAGNYMEGKMETTIKNLEIVRV